MKTLPYKKYLAAAGLAIVFGSSKAFACTCVDMGESVDDKIIGAFNGASVIFSGKVVALEYQKGISNAIQEEYLKSKGRPFDFETQVVKFEVDSWWKTELPPIFFLATDTTKNADGTGGSSSCDYGFEIGKSYLVYARGKGRETRNMACSRTTQLDRAKDDLKKLGPGQNPLPNHS